MINRKRWVFAIIFVVALTGCTGDSVSPGSRVTPERSERVLADVDASVPAPAQEGKSSSETGRSEREDRRRVESAATQSEDANVVSEADALATVKSVSGM